MAEKNNTRPRADVEDEDEDEDEDEERPLDYATAGQGPESERLAAQIAAAIAAPESDEGRRAVMWLNEDFRAAVRDRPTSAAAQLDALLAHLAVVRSLLGRTLRAKYHDELVALMWEAALSAVDDVDVQREKLNAAVTEAGRSLAKAWTEPDEDVVVEFGARDVRRTAVPWDEDRRTQAIESHANAIIGRFSLSHAGLAGHLLTQRAQLIAAIRASASRSPRRRPGDLGAPDARLQLLRSVGLALSSDEALKQSCKRGRRKTGRIARRN